MYKKMKKKTRVGILLLMVIMLIIAFAIFWFNGETRDYLLTGDNINRISAYELQDEKIVRGQLYAILGCYAEDDKGAYYVIPVGENEYMGVYLEEKYEDRAWQIVQDTVDYVNGKREDVSSYRILTGGMVYSMDSVERQYFHEWFTDTGYMDEEDVSLYTVDYTYAVIPFNEWNNSDDIICYVFIGICLAVALLCFFWMVTGRDVAAVKKTIRQSGWNPEEIEADILSGFDKKNVMVGRKYILQNSGWKWNLYPVRDVIWAYQFTHTTEHRLYGVIKTGTTVIYSVQFYLRNGKMKAISTKSEQEAQEILEFFARTQPHIIVGYSDELRAICQNNFNRLIQLSNEKEMQYGQNY
ncbi:MAG: hypothetical protein NC089_05265 [Bacteroides sp.]|nr:hypothetical protein [Bacteroides sp.]MCM1549592.1 hypothetical protein [Clostridium sp.]